MEHDGRMSLAWHTARLNAYAPAKSDKFIKLKELLHKDQNAKSLKQGWEAQLEATKAWMASRSRR